MTILAAAAPGAVARYSLLVATGGAQVRAAQRLRYQVFAEEFGAVLESSVPGVDIDGMDAHCDHLIIREDTSGEVVGTYRMLPPGRTPRLYAEGEFDLRRLAPLTGALVEAGRSCVHPAHRNGAVINLMWAGIARYMHLAGYRWLAGCASVPLDDGGGAAAAVWRLARDKHLAPPAWRVRPHRPWPVPYAVDPDAADPDAATTDAATRTDATSAPPLLRGYLRLGAWICGPPAHDPDFAVADFFVLLSLDRMNPRYLRHLLGQR
jgi:putative hemolysin